MLTREVTVPKPTFNATAEIPERQVSNQLDGESHHSTLCVKYELRNMTSNPPSDLELQAEADPLQSDRSVESSKQSSKSADSTPRVGADTSGMTDGSARSICSPMSLRYLSPALL